MEVVDRNKFLMMKMEDINNFLGRDKEVSSQTRELANVLSRELGREVKCKEKILLHPEQIAEADLDEDEIREINNKKIMKGGKNG